MMYLDLEELQSVLELSPWWSDKSWRPVRFVRKDFLGPETVPLDQAVRDRIYQQTGIRHSGPVRMLANLRYYGYNINPISCYYCFDESEQLQFVVSEVVNTPWKERQSYVLQCDQSQAFQHFRFQKEMHVSPFNPMDMTYLWCSNNPSKMLNINLETEFEGQIQLDATLALQRHEITAASLNGILLEHPWMTAKVATTIYWQALKIWLKKNPFYSHPKFQGWGGNKKSTITELKTKQ